MNTASILLASLGWLAAPAVADTIHGIVVFSRHGDRTTKYYGAQALTKLGATQNFQVGSDYRQRYLESGSPYQILGISEDAYVSSQIFASAPDQGILLNTATAFLQGLYPPLGDIDPQIAADTLNNNSASMAPLNGYQYVNLHAASTNSPDTIWIKGDEGCPTVVKAQNSFEDSAEFKANVEATRPFYEKFFSVLSPGVYNIDSPDELSYADAFNVFDLINVARIHNASSAALSVSDEDLFQLRTLADSAEFGYNFNSTDTLRAMGGKTLAGAVLSQLNQTVSTKGKLKFSLMAGSYDVMLAFFGLSGLTSVSGDFFGLPGYASTLAWEVFSPDNVTTFPSNTDDLQVRFMFRNGTAGTLTAFPLFGTGQESLPYNDFVSKMSEFAMQDLGTWCSVCESKVNFCAAYNDDEVSVSSSTSTGKGMSNAVAGVIGAMVTLAVALIVGALAFVLLRRRRGSAVAAASPNAAGAESKKSVSESDSGHV